MQHLEFIFLNCLYTHVMSSVLGDFLTFFAFFAGEGGFPLFYCPSWFWKLQFLHFHRTHGLWLLLCTFQDMGFPGGLEGKASACNAGDPGLIPGLGRSPREGNGNLLQYSCLENPMDGEAWSATVYEVTKSWTRLSNDTVLRHGGGKLLDEVGSWGYTQTLGATHTCYSLRLVVFKPTGILRWEQAAWVA